MEIPINSRLIPIGAPKLNRSNERGPKKNNTLFLQVEGLTLGWHLTTENLHTSNFSTVLNQDYEGWYIKLQFT
jgi:hypothetical protein